MSWPFLFSALNLAAVCGWLVLIFAPRSWRFLTVVPRYVVPGVIALVYTALMGAYLVQSGGWYGSIAQVRQLFASDPVLVAGWGHYLAFDLLVGVMLADRMDRARVHRVIQAPIFITIFMFGPAGWLLGVVTEWFALNAGQTHQESTHNV